MPEAKRYSVVTIDGVRYVPADEAPVREEERTLLTDLYGRIWAEAHYDPDNEHTEKFSRRLWPTVQRLNELMGFRR